MFGEIEGTGVDILDDRFSECLTGHARVERLWSGARWTEGPVWFAAGRYLLFSDIPNNRLMRWDETDANVSEFRKPSHYCNGNTIDQEGRLISCEHLTRRVTRTEHDGSISVIADMYEGKKLNSPNDVVVKSDGSIWFTDPTYGILSDYEGRKAPSKQKGCYVYRVNSNLDEVTAVATDFVKPNGLAFNSEENILYVSDTGASHRKNGPKHIRKLILDKAGTKVVKSVAFVESPSGLPDGLRVDSQDRVWTSGGDGVYCFTPDGLLIGKIRIPEVVSNLCFGGAKLNRLFITGTTSLYAIYLAVNGKSSKA